MRELDLHSHHSHIIGYLTQLQYKKVDILYIHTYVRVVSFLCSCPPPLQYTLMMVFMVVFQLAFTSVLLGLVYAPQEVRVLM